MQDPLLPDTQAEYNEVFAALYEVYQSQIAGTAAESPAAAFFWQNYFKPLWETQLEHPDGLITGPQLGSVAAFPTEAASDQPVVSAG